MKKAKLLQFIAKLQDDTTRKWRTLDSYRNPNAALADYIEHYTPVPQPEYAEYRPFFETLQLQVNQSVLTKFSDGLIYIFYFYKPKRYAVIKGSSKRKATFNTIHMIVAVQPSENDDIEELNKPTEVQDELRKVYNKARNLIDKGDAFVNSFLGDS